MEREKVLRCGVSWARSLYIPARTGGSYTDFLLVLPVCATSPGHTSERVCVFVHTLPVPGLSLALSTISSLVSKFDLLAFCFALINGKNFPEFVAFLDFSRMQYLPFIGVCCSVYGAPNKAQTPTYLQVPLYFYCSKKVFATKPKVSLLAQHTAKLMC